jgi:hypothetical protein
MDLLSDKTWLRAMSGGNVAIILRFTVSLNLVVLVLAVRSASVLGRCTCKGRETFCRMLTSFVLTASADLLSANWGYVTRKLVIRLDRVEGPRIRHYCMAR